MIVAQPNGGKSMLSLFYCINANIPTMYFSADTDRRTTWYRAAAIKTGIEFNDIKDMIGTSGQSIVDEAINEITMSGIQFDFNPKPTLRDIDLELQAYVEVYGVPPKLVVIDNLLNCSNDAGDFNGLVEILGDLHALAREMDCALIILHHVNESTSKPEYPASRSSIRGKVAQYPEMVLSLAMLPEEGIMRIAMVKHRHATPSPDASNYETIYVDPTRMTFYNTKADLSASLSRREWI
jgi:RecA-family ATPase